MAQMAAVKTPATAPQIIQALHDAYVSQMGGPPADETLAILCSQVALECAGGRSIICNNVGNLKAYGGVDFTQFMTTEWIGTPPTPQKMVCSFAAYPSLEAGCAAYMALLYKHYGNAWSGAVAGSAVAFVTGLHAGGYFTAPVTAYLAGVQRWLSYYLPMVTGDDEAITEPEVQGIDYVIPDPPERKLTPSPFEAVKGLSNRVAAELAKGKDPK
jgi:hypothetical protein